MFRSLIPVLLLAFSTLAAAADKPNILFILTDDQGWPTLGCYGGKIVPTPNLDKLAAQGARFTDFYVTSQCTPTRASFITGQYTARNGLWHVLPWYGYPHARITEPPYLENYSRETFTVAKGLQTAGYATGIAGKWHLTANPEDGFYNGMNPKAAPHFGFDWAAPVINQPELVEKPGADRGVNAYTDNAIDFISRHKDEPWFFFLSHHMIHAIVVAPDVLTEKYRKLGYGDEGPNRAVYLAGLEHIDHSIGRLMDALEKMGEAEDTLVIFTSDNGGIDEKFDFKAADSPNPDFEPDMIEYDNAPLRMGKGSGYEGGIRVPMIARWPGKIAPGSVIDTPTHIVDMAATFFDVAGTTAPDHHPLDGEILTPLLKGEAPGDLATRPVFQYYPFYDLRWGLTPSASIRQGDHKLIEFFGDCFDDAGQFHAGHHVELYDLKSDPGESHNLATDQPELAEKLKSRLHAWMNQLDAEVPTANPRFDPDRAFEETRQKPEWLQNATWQPKE